jgi:hypothetical protein
LDNGGFIHLAFGAILGVSAYGRSQEKTKSLEMNGNNIDANIANNTVADDKK